MMDKNQDLNTDDIDFDELEEELQSQLDEQLLDWDMLETEKEQIGNVEVLCDTMKAVVWEQCINQIAIVAGEDFIEENRGLTLDLSNDESQKDEAFRISKYAVRAVAMQLLASLVKEIISQLIKWLKKKKRSLESLLESIKLAIQSFIEKLKENLLEASETLLTTIATAILGPVVGTIKKIWGMLNQGGKSLVEAIAFFNNPAHVGMPIGIKLLEVGKIVMVGLSGIGATVLGEVIEKELMLIPAFMVEIPMFGTLANIIGLFMGAIVAGIIGAIVLYLMDQIIGKSRKTAVLKGQIEKGNEILGTQKALIGMIEDKHASKKEDFSLSISDRHAEAAQTIRDSISNTNHNKSETMEYSQELEEMGNSLDLLLGEG